MQPRVTPAVAEDPTTLPTEPVRPLPPVDCLEHELRTTVGWLGWGSLLPGVGWAYGLSLLWASTLFTTRDKVLGTLLFPGGWSGAFVAAWFLTRQSSGYCFEASVGSVGTTSPATEAGCVQLGLLPGGVGLVLTLLVLLAAAVGPAYLRRRGRQGTART